MITAAHRPWRPTLLLTRSFIADYVRNPVNVVVLVLVPLVFVVVAARSLADAMELLGGRIGPALETATAGWAAGFLSSLAMYFQIRSARAADKRMLLAGLPSARLIAARAGTGLLLAGLVSAVALIALAVRTGIDSPGRVIAGTLMFALIYMAIGALVGAAIGNPVNGAVVILFIWMVDVFFGPGGSAGDQIVSRFFPTHFVTLWMVDLPSRHGGRLGDLGIALVWLVGAIVMAGVVLARVSRTARRARRSSGQYLTAVRFGLVDLRRNPVLLVLLVIVPATFILLAEATTPARTQLVGVTENGATSNQPFWFPEVHAGTMAPIAIASLAALAGMFVVIDAADPDRRLRLAGYRAWVAVAARLSVVAAAVIVISIAGLAVTATVFDPRQWVWFAAANILLAATYALIGVLIGPLFGRVAGVFIAFLIPFLDLGIVQSPMLRPSPAPWAQALPGYSWTKVLFDTGLTAHFDQTAALLAGLAWLGGLGIAATLILARGAKSA
ncbi:ABC transporter permease [Mycolicibacterium cosmeticum]|uniref:ABC transporter permease n=1 Tax=Mycolicibacterium cosmeticum TaxID=258533 RepID=UPI003204F8AF